MVGTMRQDLYQELYEVENSHWWHRHKRKLIHQLIKRWIKQPGRVLDVGAGTGRLLKELKQAGWQVAGIDAEKQALVQSLKRGIKLKQVDLEKNKLPFKSQSFDLVTCLDSLEHLKNEATAIKEMKRVLKPGGLMIISVPAYQWLFSYWDEMLGHYRRYSKKRLRRLGNDSRLKLVWMSHWASFVLVPAITVRLIKRRAKTQPVSDFETTPLALISEPILNLLAIIERWWLKITKLPIGMSLICVFQRA